MAGVEGDRVTLDRELARLLADGEKIAAIKLLRERRGMGLAEAKDVVDRAVAASGAAPECSAPRIGLALQQASPRPAAARAARNGLRTLRALLVVIAAGVALWRALR